MGGGLFCRPFLCISPIVEAAFYSAALSFEKNVSICMNIDISSHICYNIEDNNGK